MDYITIKNWERYQHFTDGRPVKWVKVYVDLLDKYDREGKENAWRNLSDKAVRLCVALWLLRGRYENIPNDSAWIEAQTGVAPKFAVQELIQCGFVTLSKSRNESGTNPVRDCNETETGLEQDNAESGSLDLRDRVRDRKREEEEKENRNGSGAEEVPSSPSPSSLLKILVDDWNEVATAHGLSKVLHVGARSKAAKERLADAWWRDNYRAALAAIPQSDFLIGSVPGKAWKADFEFFVRPDSAAKILEGKYANQSSAQKAKKQEADEPEKPPIAERIRAYRAKYPDDPEDYMMREVCDSFEYAAWVEQQQRKRAAVATVRQPGGVTRLGDVLNAGKVSS